MRLVLGLLLLTLGVLWLKFPLTMTRLFSS
jgi:hypothetical protein